MADDWFNKVTGQLIAPHTDTPQASPSGGSGITDSVAAGAPLATAFRAGMPPDSADQTRRFAAARFPGLQNPEQYYGRDAEGRLYYTDPFTGKSAYEIPSAAGQTNWFDKFMAVGSQAFNAAPAAIPDAVGAMVGTMTANPALGVAAAGATAGVVDAGRQMLDRALAGENPTDIDLLNSAGHAVATATGEGVARAAGAGAKVLYDRNPGRLKPGDVLTLQADPSRIQQANDLAKYAIKNNSFLTVGEAANLPGQLSRERYLRTTPEGARFAGQVGSRMETDVPRIAGNAIGAVKSPDTAITNLRQAATDTMDKLAQYRSDRASPLYQEAYVANPSVMSKEISGILDTPAGMQALKEAATLAANKQQLVGIPDAELGALARELADLGKMEHPSGGVAAGLKLSTLDYIKQTLWAMGERAYKQGDDAAGRAYKSLGFRLKNQLDQLDSTAIRDKAGNITRPGKYAEARQIYGDESSAVTESERLLKRFADQTGAPLANNADTFFSAARTTPGEAARARLLFASSGKLDTWNDALNTWMADRYMDVAKRTGDGNMAKAIYKDLWNEKQQRVIASALGDSGRKLDDLTNMFAYMKAVGKQLGEGSPTGANSQEAKVIAEQSAPLIRKALSVLSIQNIGTASADYAADAATRANTAKLIQVALKPENSAALKNLRMIGPKWQRGIPTLVRLFNQAGLIPLRGMSRPPEQAPAFRPAPPALSPTASQ